MRYCHCIFGLKYVFRRSVTIQKDTAKYHATTWEDIALLEIIQQQKLGCHIAFYGAHIRNQLINLVIPPAKRENLHWRRKAKFGFRFLSFQPISTDVFLN